MALRTRNDAGRRAPDRAAKGAGRQTGLPLAYRAKDVARLLRRIRISEISLPFRFPSPSVEGGRKGARKIRQANPQDLGEPRTGAGTSRGHSPSRRVRPEK